MTEAAAQDAEVTAERLDFNHDQTIEYMRVEDVWDATTDAVERLAPASYVSAWRSGPATPDPRVLFTTAPPGSVVDLLRLLPFDTTIMIGASSSGASLGDIGDLAYHTVASISGTQVLTTSIDPATGTIVIAVDHRTSDALLTTEQQAVAAAPGLANHSIVVQRAAQGSSISLLSHTGGGKDLDYKGSLDCTSGFATTSDGTTGLSTAKHRNDGLTWDTRRHRAWRR